MQRRRPFLSVLTAVVASAALLLGPLAPAAHAADSDRVSLTFGVHGAATAKVFIAPGDDPGPQGLDPLGIFFAGGSRPLTAEQETPCYYSTTGCVVGQTYTSSWQGDPGEPLYVNLVRRDGDGYASPDVMWGQQFSRQQLSTTRWLFRNCPLVDGVRSTACRFSVLVTLPGSDAALEPTPTPVPTATPAPAPVPVPTVSPAPVRRTYASLGDSYSSGEGNPPYDDGTDLKVDRCHRSFRSWTQQLAFAQTRYRPLSEHAFIACSGATTDALTDVYNGEVPQLRSLTGLPAQPDLITVTLGGNDLGFAKVLGACYAKLTGKSCEKAVQKSVAKTGSVKTKLLDAYRRIHDTAPKATILVVGYPNLMSTSRTAGLHCPWLNAKDRRLLRSCGTALDRYLRTTVKSVQGKYRTRYASSLDALDGHELCTSDSYVNSISIPGKFTQAAGHPTQLGQLAMLKRVVAQLP